MFALDETIGRSELIITHYVYTGYPMNERLVNIDICLLISSVTYNGRAFSPCSECRYFDPRSGQVEN